MILALPGETHESFVNGIDAIVSNGQHNRIQFNNLSILPNAEMGNIEYQKKFGFKTVISDIINTHGSLDEERSDPSIREKQVLVVETDSMPGRDWLKTRAYCWMTSLLHFDKVLQIPIILLHKHAGIKYRDVFDIFMNENYTKQYPALEEIRQFFVNKAIHIQNGGEEYCEAKEWLNIWWPADEYMFIKLVTGNKITNFYAEAESLLSDLIKMHQKDIDPQLLHQAVLLNHTMLKLPFHTDDVSIPLNYDILKFYRSCLENENVVLEKIKTTHLVERSKSIYTNWEQWYKEVVWYGTKKGAYLHGNWGTEYQLEGHY